jgi:hypothetical protein
MRLNPKEAAHPHRSVCKVAKRGAVVVDIHVIVSFDETPDDVCSSNNIGSDNDTGTKIQKASAQEESRGRRLADGDMEEFVPLADMNLPWVCSLVMDVKISRLSKLGLMFESSSTGANPVLSGAQSEMGGILGKSSRFSTGSTESICFRLGSGVSAIS